MESGDPRARNRRLEVLLAQLAEQGITQQQIARQMNVPASYLSDVKLGRKTLTDTFARLSVTSSVLDSNGCLTESDRRSGPSFHLSRSPQTLPR